MAVDFYLNDIDNMGHKHSKESILKMSIAKTGHRHSKETKLKISQAQLGLLFKSKQVIDPNSPQAKVWPEIANTHCYLTKSKVRSRARREWIKKFGHLTSNQIICHKCDNIFGPCCNFLHLFLGTRSENSKDMYNKDRRNQAAFIKKVKGKKKPKGFSEKVLKTKRTNNTLKLSTETKAKLSKACSKSIKEWWRLRKLKSSYAN